MSVSDARSTSRTRRRHASPERDLVDVGGEEEMEEYLVAEYVGEGGGGEDGGEGGGLRGDDWCSTVSLYALRTTMGGPFRAQWSLMKMGSASEEEERTKQKREREKRMTGEK